LFIETLPNVTSFTCLSWFHVWVSHPEPIFWVDLWLCSRYLQCTQSVAQICVCVCVCLHAGVQGTWTWTRCILSLCTFCLRFSDSGQINSSASSDCIPGKLLLKQRAILQAKITSKKVGGFDFISFPAVLSGARVLPTLTDSATSA